MRLGVFFHMLFLFGLLNKLIRNARAFSFFFFFYTDQETGSWRWADLPKATELMRNQAARCAGLQSLNTWVQTPAPAPPYCCVNLGHGQIAFCLNIFTSNEKMMMLRVTASTSGTCEDSVRYTTQSTWPQRLAQSKSLINSRCCDCVMVTATSELAKTILTGLKD